MSSHLFETITPPAHPQMIINDRKRKERNEREKGKNKISLYRYKRKKNYVLCVSKQYNHCIYKKKTKNITNT